mgnify:CR=1 FL=1
MVIFIVMNASFGRQIAIAKVKLNALLKKIKTTNWIQIVILEIVLIVIH